MTKSGQLFGLGRTTITATAKDVADDLGIDPLTYFHRHHAGDWGDMDEVDKAANDNAVASGDERIFSTYKVSDSTTFYLITEADRSVTTLMLSTDY